MLRGLLSWLRTLLGAGVPAILTISSGLTGTGGDDDAPIDGRPSLPEALNWHLGKAEAFLEVHEIERAKIELEAADRISSGLRPHTPQHERLVQHKTQLWQRVAPHQSTNGETTGRQ